MKSSNHESRRNKSLKERISVVLAFGTLIALGAAACDNGTSKDTVAAEQVVPKHGDQAPQYDPPTEQSVESAPPPEVNTLQEVITAERQKIQEANRDAVLDIMGYLADPSSHSAKYGSDAIQGIGNKVYNANVPQSQWVTEAYIRTGNDASPAVADHRSLVVSITDGAKRIHCVVTMSETHGAELHETLGKSEHLKLSDFADAVNDPDSTFACTVSESDDPAQYDSTEALNGATPDAVIQQSGTYLKMLKKIEKELKIAYGE